LDSLNDDDLDEGDDNEFGMESGGWCCFTNSLPIIYLQIWLNEKPDLTHFVSRQIPQDVQLDTSNSMASKKQRASDTSSQCKSIKSQKKSPNEAVAEALIGYIKTKEAETVNPRNMIESLGAELQTFMRAQSTMEKIDLLEKQISVVTKRVEQSKTEEQCQRYSAALEKLKSELNDLVLPTSK
jgi:valyl-tRNA synthetase